MVTADFAPVIFLGSGASFKGDRCRREQAGNQVIIGDDAPSNSRWATTPRAHLPAPVCTGFSGCPLIWGKIGVVLHHRGHHPQEGLVVLNAGILLVRVLLRVGVGRVRGHPGRNGLGDQSAHPVGILPPDVAEVFVEHPDDVGEPVQFGLRAVPAAGRHRLDFGILVRQDDPFSLDTNFVMRSAPGAFGL